MVKEKTIHDVPVPAGVDTRMVEVAKYYVTTRLQDGFTMNGMFQKFGMSSKTFYKWLENPDYQNYINEMANVLIPQDELEAVRKFRKKVMAFADKDSLTSPEMKLFLDLFEPIIKADIRMQMEKLGLNSSTSSSTGDSQFKSLEERKQALLTRLKVSGPKTNKGEDEDEL